jgi:NADPH:quinone reductase-like Zn-dependent oxidoreductase
MPEKMMKAVRLHGYGGIESLVYEDALIPEPGLGELLVKTTAVSVNPIDWKLRRGDLKTVRPLEFPAILGRDLSGVVAHLGQGVTGLKVGERVFGLVNRSYAEYVVCKPEDLARIPDRLDSIEAAALPLVLLTGAQVIERGVRPRSGETILVSGAIGGVGRTAVHVARRHGAHVIAGVRASQKAEAEGLGADRIVALDDEKDIAGLPELDAVADMVDHETIDRIIPHIKKNGVLATVLGKPKSAEWLDLRVEMIWAQPDSVRLEELGREVARGEFSIPIGKRLKLSQMPEAHRLAEKGGIGKIVLTR